MKIRKSTLILLITIVVTIILGGLAVFTANLLQKRKVREEKAKAAGNWCNELTFNIVPDQTGFTNNGKKFRVTLQAKNETNNNIDIKLKTYISQCRKQGTDICAERLLLGQDESHWKGATLQGNAQQTFTFEADTGTSEQCGRIQYDVILLDAKISGTRLEGCIKDEWVATQIINTQKDCGCVINSSASTIAPGGSMDLTAKIFPSTSLEQLQWSDQGVGGNFNPQNQISTTYTAPSTISQNQINITFSGAVKGFPEAPRSVSYGGGYNAIKQTASKYYLPGVANNSRPTDNASITFDKTNIYIFNPNPTQQANLTIDFYRRDGGQQAVTKSIGITIGPNETKVESTNDNDLFGTDPFYGTAVVDSNNNEIIVTYEKIETNSTRAWTLEGIPDSQASTNIYHSPVISSTMNWGVSNHYITIFNPSSNTIQLEYSFYYNDGYVTAPKNPQLSPKISLNPYETYTFDINEIIPAQDPRDPTNPNWWIGQVQINTTANVQIVSISEDVGTNGQSGSHGNFGRGRVASVTPSSKLCLLPITNHAYGILKTGYGFANISGNPEDGTATIKYYSASGKEVSSENAPLRAHEGYHKDTEWAGLPTFHGAAVVTVTNNLPLIGGVHDLADNDVYGRATVGIPCDDNNLTNTLYLTGLLAGSQGTPATSIQVFNPSDSQDVTGTIHLYGANGTEDAKYDFYLKPHAMDGPIIWSLVKPGWMGSAKIEADQKIVATSLSHSGALDNETSTCGITLNVQQTPQQFSCTLNANPSQLQKGESSTVTLNVNDSNSTGHSYSYSLADTPAQSGSFTPASGSITPGTPLTSTYTVSQTASNGTVTLTATITRNDNKTATCTDSITITSQPPTTMLDCSGINVSTSRPTRGQTITAQAIVTNNTGQTETYEWQDTPHAGTFNPNNQQTVQYTVGNNATGTIAITTTVRAGNYQDTCSTTLTIAGGGQPGTAFLPPFVSMVGTSGALMGTGAFISRNKTIYSIVERIRRKSFEERSIYSIKRRRRNI